MIPLSIYHSPNAAIYRFQDIFTLVFTDAVYFLMA